jgi:60 kDa SS-A/Ro ribonucleoprotein
MANKSLFAGYAGKLLPRANAKNRESAPAYAYGPKHKLAQLAVTGTLSRTFYATSRAQLADVMEQARNVEPAFLAKAAIYARTKGHMKDMPALLLAALSASDPVALTRAFPRVVDNGRMLRTFVQIMRSGTTGRKSLGSRPKALVQAWLNQASDAAILRAAVGQSPSLADVIKMVHPKPNSAERAALFAYLIGKPYDVAKVPEAVRAFEAFKRDAANPVPDVPFQMLTALELTPQHWAAIAKSAGWQMLRMNLNTFDRNCVFAIDGFAEMVAGRLRDPVEIARARVPALPADGGVCLCQRGCAGDRPRRTAGCHGDRDRERAENRGPCCDLPRRFGLDGVPCHRLPQGCHIGSALHRRGGIDGRGDASGEPWCTRAAVRE